MKIGVFTYDAPHRKTWLFLTELVAAGYKPALVMAAPWEKLNIRRSLGRATIKSEHVPHPRDLSAAFGIRYEVVPHDRADGLAFDVGLDLGIVLGARILKKRVIDSFKRGVLNLHPGLIPQNRGLDAVKWAVHYMQAQGATAHLIDERVDAGRVLAAEKVCVFKDDALIDVSERVLDTERKLMIEAIRMVEAGACGQLVPPDNPATQFYAKAGDGTEVYHRPMPPAIEAGLPARFAYYREHYDQLLKTGAWLNPL